MWTIKKVTPAEAGAVCQVIQEVHDRMENKDLFVPCDLTYIEAHIEREGFILAAYAPTGKMAGNFIIRYPMEHEDNLGRDAHLPPEELQKVAHMESAVVLPEYRGNHLQSKMMQYAEQVIDTSRFCYLMATASPDNPASCKCMESNGYALIATKEKYGGLMRRIYYKKI